MEITFDPGKSTTNLAKHGVPLALANEIAWDEILDWPDVRKNYQEKRMAGLAPIGNRLYFVVYVDRPEEKPTERRVISLRKANLREVKRYETDN